MKILITGGAGFIGSAVIREIIQHTSHEVVNVDCLTYAGNLESLGTASASPRYSYSDANICDPSRVKEVFEAHQPDAVMHLAAESHVDRSIDGPQTFLETNLVGTYVLLESARAYWAAASTEKKQSFRFHHISTDEVFGDLASNAAPFSETTPYNPSSPYSATKAGSDHLVRAWGRTYGLPILVTNCSNNYGPFQFPEKLIPHIILNALKRNPLPVYGDGRQIRDWLHVEDHARALVTVIEKGRIGETYNIGGRNEIKNLTVVERVCEMLDEFQPLESGKYSSLISFVKDRPGHDRRYAINAEKINNDLGWAPQENFESGLKKTIRWYLENKPWWSRVLSGAYRLERLGRSKEGMR